MTSTTCHPAEPSAGRRSDLARPSRWAIAILLAFCLAAWLHAGFGPIQPPPSSLDWHGNSAGVSN